MSDARADAILEEFERAGLIKRTGEMRRAKRHREWQPVYVITELGKRLHEADIDWDWALDGTVGTKQTAGATEMTDTPIRAAESVTHGEDDLEWFEWFEWTKEQAAAQYDPNDEEFCNPEFYKPPGFYWYRGSETIGPFAALDEADGAVLFDIVERRDEAIRRAQIAANRKIAALKKRSGQTAN